MTPVHLREGYWVVKPPTYIHNPEYSFEQSLVLMCSGKGGYDELVVRGFSKNRPTVPAKYTIKLEPGSWQILCTLKDCTPMQALLIVERFAVNLPTYRNYEWPKGSDFFWKPMDSLHSLLRSKGLDTETNILIMQNNSDENKARH
jgi:hypothetical protein